MVLKDVQIKYDIEPSDFTHIIVVAELREEHDGFECDYVLTSTMSLPVFDLEKAEKLVNSHPFLRIKDCESPIETRFYVFAIEKLPELMPQHSIADYRTDFALVEKKIAIEIDGHEYHKTRGQRTNDANRERDLQLMGWQVIRFTGTEIYRDTSSCVKQVEDLVGVFSRHPVAWDTTLRQVI